MTWESIQEFMSNPALISAGILGAFNILLGIANRSLTKSGVMKDKDMLTMAAEITALKKENGDLKTTQQQILEGIYGIGTMVNTAYSNSKLSVEAKQSIDSIWSPIVGNLGDIAVKMYEQKSTLIEDALNAILPDEEDSPILAAVKETIGDAAEDLIEDAVEKLPQAIETVSSILGR